MFDHILININSYTNIVFWIVLYFLLIHVLNKNENYHPIRYITIGIVILVLVKVIDIYLLHLGLKGTMHISALGYFGILNFHLFILGISFVILSMLSFNKNSEEENGLEIKWSWIAFIFCPIWSIYHRIWWGLLSWIPIVGLLFSVYMGMYGSNLISSNRNK